MTLHVRPITLRAARAHVALYHRHNDPPRGHKFSIGLHDDADPIMLPEEPIGVAVVGRPVSRHLDNGLTAEAVRVCVMGHAPKGACSKLYRHAWRAWRAMGGRKLITYTLQSESGASLRGAGFVVDAIVPAKSDEGWTNRKGRKKQRVVGEPKIRWAVTATGTQE